jgi:hypothetical protein
MSPFHFCLSAAKNLSLFQLLPTSLITNLLQLFLGLPFFLFLWGFQSRAAFGISPSSFFNVWPIHLTFLFVISKLLAVNSLLLTLHYSCVFELNFVSPGWQSVTWSDWRVCPNHPSSVGLGPLSKDWEQFMLLGRRVTSLQGKKVGKVYFIGVNCL